MTVRSFVYENVRHVRVTHLGSGSVVVEPGPRDDAVEGTLGCSDPTVLEQVTVGVDGTTLRIAFPPRPHVDGHLRLGVPDGLDYMVDAGSADVTVRAP
ncbi:MAG: hypothetical protein ACLGIF_10345, partial [Actinomycetes bacterium]